MEALWLNGHYFYPNMTAQVTSAWSRAIAIIVGVLAVLMVYLLGTGLFSFQWSGALLHHGLRALAINLPPETERWLNINLRLVAHVGQYFVLFFVLAWLPGLSPTKVLGLTMLAAMADEVHQYFVPSRTCSPRDLVLDLAGALAAYVLYLMWRRWHQAKGGGQQPAPRRSRAVGGCGP